MTTGRESVRSLAKSVVRMVVAPGRVVVVRPANSLCN